MDIESSKIIENIHTSLQERTSKFYGGESSIRERWIKAILNQWATCFTYYSDGAGWTATKRSLNCIESKPLQSEHFFPHY